MNEINFLPLRLIQRQHQRARLFRECVVVGGVLLCCVVWYIGQRGRSASLENLVAAKQEELAAAKRCVVEVECLAQQREQLTYQLQIQKRLTRPITHSTLLAVMTDLIPDSLAIIELTLVAQTPAPPLKHKANAAGKKSLPPKPQAMHVQLVGISPSDVAVANLVARLSDHPVFSNVKMRYSRSIRLEHVLARQFRVEMDVPLSRCYRPMKDKGQEMADAN